MSTTRLSLLVLQVLAGLGLLLWIVRTLRTDGELRQRIAKTGLALLAIVVLLLTTSIAAAAALGAGSVATAILLIGGVAGVVVAYINSRRRT